MTQHDHDLPAAPPQNGRILDARLHLLDRQLLNGDDDPVGIVDDLELAGIEEDQPIPPGTEPPIVTAILSGHVLATRIFGGQPPRTRLQRIPWAAVRRVGTVVNLNTTDVPFDSQWLEHWLRNHVIAHIPGGRRAAQ
ncbi:hypothetical protein MMUR_00140 [Mycolicibacterium murale]|uniref:Uncharacterized protein n=1 Tax=Mycolicibacterium murale TaxID=182220 RepID=A0A7I9WEY0_9MYCO|nr:hypothetical protein [Mycolicibacterium murale]MCV7180581.1 hypothetical protein [Mycolicibacterium murale]GFG55878.1 hypothetical protein MMUR_00140 [Mycolicibacterium murale]